MRSLLVLLVMLSTPALAQSQTPAGPPSFLRQFAETRMFNSGRPVAASISPDEKTVYFLRAPPRSNVMTLFAFDVATGQTREVLTPATVLHGAAETLSPEERARRERMRMSSAGFSSYELSEDGTKVRLTLSGRVYVVETATQKVTELPLEPGVLVPSFSRDGKQAAFVRDNDVYRVDLATGRVQRVTKGGTAARSHGLAEFIAQEEMGRFEGYWWSPDAKAIAFTESDTSGVEKRTFVDPMFPERGGETLSYPRAGTPNAQVKLGIASLTGGATVWVDWDAKAYPYLATVTWPKKGPLTVLVQSRTQTEELLLAVDEKTGKTRTLLTERDAAWVNLDQPFPKWLDDGSGFLWSTERNGAPELELRAPDGSLVRSLVKPDAGYRALVNYQPQADIVDFLGGPNPTERYLYRVTRGGAPTRVTSGGPAVESARTSAQAGLFVITSEGLTQMRRQRIVRADGTEVGVLPSLAEEPSFTPTTEVRQVGAEKFWTAITRPRDFRPGVKLPVIVEIYGAAVPLVQHAMARNLLSQWMADQGFIVVKFDGRGTALRGRDWERALKYDFGGVPLDDQVTALRALAAEVPEMDLRRVGITGWSHGGYMSAMAVLKRPDVFKAAVAGAPVVDWRDYDTHCTERFLGTPQEHPEAYEKTSLLTYAKQDKPMGKLLLIHGTNDDNVFFLHSLKLSDALFQAGKAHELLPLAGSSHMLSNPAVSERQWQRVMRFFQDNL
ncbi:DPP IV N-terminal domain-containing protein [Myxococcaceae bacterium JPH2]|nr:DPP IV N-terminal domain-containing protein [Myxococcaceae bacterium JPH2]